MQVLDNVLKTLFLLNILVSIQCSAQPGTLDKSFGNNGIVITDFNHNNDYGQKLALQTDGKILLAGYSVDSVGRANIFVCRYLNSDFLIIHSAKMEKAI